MKNSTASLPALLACVVLTACSGGGTSRRAQDGTAIAASERSAGIGDSSNGDSGDSEAANGKVGAKGRTAVDLPAEDSSASATDDAETGNTGGATAGLPAAGKAFPLIGTWRSSCVNEKDRATRNNTFYYRSEDLKTEIDDLYITITITSWADADCKGKSEDLEALDDVYTDYGPSPKLAGAQQFVLKTYSFVGMVKDQKLLFAIASEAPKNFGSVTATTKLAELTPVSYNQLMGQ